MCQCIARACTKAGIWFSVENPAGSILWLMPGMLRFARMQGVRFTLFDQCCFGSAYVEPTAFLANAPWMDDMAQRSPGFPEHPRRPPLRGKVWVPAREEMLWKTELAA